MRNNDYSQRRELQVVLSGPQQATLMPQLTNLACHQLGISPSQAGGIVVETLARLTPDMTTSEFTIFKVLGEETAAYRADPEAYDWRGSYTTYRVLALLPDAPADLGAYSPDILQLHEPTLVPRNAVPQSEWWDFAQQVDGYGIAGRLGWNLNELAQTVLDYHRRTGRWRGGLTDLRLTLFWIARALRHTGEALEDRGEENIREVASLLRAIATLYESQDGGRS